MKSVITILVIVLTLANCTQEELADAPSESIVQRVLPTAAFTVGDLTPEGRLIFWSIDAFDHIEPFVLIEDYGVFLYNAGTDSEPLACYVLAIQDSKTILHTTRFDLFKNEVNMIPSGSNVSLYDTCSITRTYGLPESQIEEFFASLSEAGLELVDENVCYCPYNY